MQPGTHLGHYEILSALGKGGMGAVWRARDSTLGREVAIKTLPEEFARDEERLARFEREAKLLASLNHPNIATIHGLEEDSGTRFLVLELVEGDTLADRLKHGAIPVEESLKLALQIAEALEAAHEKGVIHRDLKPANIKVTPEGKVKVLDFGLAKAIAGGGSDVNLSQSPTLSMAATSRESFSEPPPTCLPNRRGASLPTKRADIWAFGCVFFEMLSGRQTWGGRTVTDVIAGLVAREPEWNSLPPNLHPRLRLVIERCLEKEAKDRGHDIADVRVDIQKVLADPDGALTPPVATAAPQRTLRLALPWTLGVLLAGSFLTGFAVWNSKPDPPKPVIRFPVVLGEGRQLTNLGRPSVALPPEGDHLVYVANRQLYLRSMDSIDAVPLRDTEGAVGPFFSPDGEWIGFWAGGQLKKAPISGGSPVPLCDTSNPLGASWGADAIVFSKGTGIWKVSPNGGEPELVIEPDEAAGEDAVANPDIVPGNWVLFVTREAQVTGFDRYKIMAQSLDTGERKNLIVGALRPQYSATGHLLYFREGTIFALPFDLSRMEVTGGSVPVVEDVRVGTGGLAGLYNVSAGGGLAYVNAVPDEGGDRRLLWVDRQGNQTALIDDLGTYGFPSISPDGNRVAFEVPRAGGGGVDVALYDIPNQRYSQFTFEDGGELDPVWTTDGRFVTYFDNAEPRAIYSKLSDGSASATMLFETGTPNTFPTSWSRDGLLAFYVNPDGANRDIHVYDADSGESSPFVATPSNERGAVFSPDGNWIAYTSDELGQDEVFVGAYPGPAQYRISTNGGFEPVWAWAGKELFYRTEDQMMAVSIETGSNFSHDPPVELFETSSYPFDRQSRGYDVHPDGERFLMVEATTRDLLLIRFVQQTPTCCDYPSSFSTSRAPRMRR